jgi:hypothetical protein
MTNSYARDAFTYGFDFPRPRSRAERLARLDALATPSFCREPMCDSASMQ